MSKEWSADEALEHAVRTGNDKGCIKAIMDGANPGMIAQSGSPVAFDAILRCDTVMLSLLLDAGADPNARNKDGKTVIHAAYQEYCDYAIKTNLDMVRIVSERGGDPSIETASGGRSPLWLAAGGGLTDALRALLAGGKGLDAPSKFGDTALMVAIGHERKNCCEVLLELGADPKAVNRGKTAIEQGLEAEDPVIKATFEKLALAEESRGRTAQGRARRL